jgi:hypothetical protein
MQLCAIVTKDDLASVIEQLTPLRVTTHPRRVITLGRPTKVELVAGAGLRVRGDARFTWDVAGGITIPVTLRAWQIMLVPSFVARNDGRHVLAFEPVLEGLDFKNVPMFLDGRIKEAINEGLAAQKHKLAWDFEKTLTLLRPLSDKLAPAAEVKLGPTGGKVTVTATDVRLTLDFALRVRRDAAPASVRMLDEASSSGAPRNGTPRTGRVASR